jgi:IS605 OrfB family transposase
LHGDGQKLNVDAIVSIVNKTYTCFRSYYQLRKKGLKAKMPYYSDELYNIIFDKQSFKVIFEEERIQLSLGKYISQNFSKVIDDRYVKISKTKYILKYHLCTKIRGDKKHYVKLGDKYVKKDNPNIIDMRFIYIKLANGLINRKLTKDSLELKYDIRQLLKSKKKLPSNVAERVKLVTNLYKKFVNKTLKKSIDGIGISDIDIRKKIKVIDVKPLYNGYNFKVNIMYRTLKNFNDFDTEFPLKDCISIDLGMTNLMVIYNPTGIQHIVRGGPIKAINEYFNKKISVIQSKNAKKGIKKFTKRMHKLLIKRENQINNAFNILVNRLYNIYKKKKQVIIGYNEEWKKSVNLGKKINRMFYQIPYKKLLNKLRLKLEKNNIKVIETNEYYTSKCDALKLEKICKHEVYSGKRISRSLFRSGNKKVIHSDLNGAINIMRKKFPQMKVIMGKEIYNPKVLKINYTCSKKQILNSKKTKAIYLKKLADKKKNIKIIKNFKLGTKEI